MDELEKFIREHRQELDRYSPPKKTWSGIRAGLGNRSRLLYYGLSAAAIIIIAVTLGALLGVYETMLPWNKKYEAFPGIRETELYYSNLASEMLMEAKPLLTEHPDLEEELITDLSHIDSICIEIKKDLQDNISNQEVIEALINNYRIKIRILNDMLDHLQKEEIEDLNPNDHAL